MRSSECTSAHTVCVYLPSKNFSTSSSVAENGKPRSRTTVSLCFPNEFRLDYRAPFRLSQILYCGHILHSSFVRRRLIDNVVCHLFSDSVEGGIRARIVIQRHRHGCRISYTEQDRLLGVFSPSPLQLPMDPKQSIERTPARTH